MAAQSLLAKLGMRMAVLGSLASLAIAAPLAAGDMSMAAHTDATRIGMYFDRTAAAEKIGMVVMGVEVMSVGPAAAQLGAAAVTNGALTYFNSTNANTVTIQSGVTSASYAVTLPLAQGGVGTVLTNDGFGVLSWSVNGTGTILGTIAATQVGYGSALDTLAGDATFTFGSVTKILGFRYGQLDAATTVPSLAEARFFYDAAQHAMAYYTDTQSVHLGQENVALVRNSTGSSIAAGKVVYLSGATGFRPNITLATNADSTGARTAGITVLPIANNADGYVVTSGIASDLNTSAFVDGDTLWLSTAGGLTATQPSDPTNQIRIGTVARAHATLGKILVQIAPMAALSGLSDVLLTAPASGDLIRYNGTLWANSTASGAGIITGSLTATRVPFASAATVLTDSANFTFTVAAGLVVSANAASPIAMGGTLNNYLELNNQNLSSGVAASSDVVCTADTGTATTQYIDLGINSSGYTGAVFGAALEGYLYTSDQHLNIGTATAAKDIRFLAGGSTVGTNTVLTLNSGTNTSARLFAITPTVVAGDAPVALTVTAAANTTNTASTEVPDVYFNMSSTKQWAAGAITTQRAFRINGPIYTFVSASTITTASTLSVSDAPIAGTNATITNRYAINVEAGAYGGPAGTAALPTYSVGNSGAGMYYNAGTFAVGLSSLNASVMTATNLSTQTLGAVNVAPSSASGSSACVFRVVAGADVAQVASTEASSVIFDLSATKEFATGALTTQRAFRIAAPTYGFVGASTITTAATLALSGAPIAGANATITNRYAINVESGAYGGPDGTAALPTYSVGQANTGMFGSVGSVVFSSNGTQRLQITNAAFTATLPWQGQDGTVAAPAYSFSGGTTTGFYRIGTNDIGISMSSSLLAEFKATSSQTIANFQLTPTAVASGLSCVFRVVASADTGQQANNEASSVIFDLSATKQWATGALGVQRAFRIIAPTYAFVGAATLTTATTLAISGAPIAGANATITNRYAINVESGAYGGPLGTAALPTYTFGSTTLGLFGVGSAATGVVGVGLNGVEAARFQVTSTQSSGNLNVAPVLVASGAACVMRVASPADTGQTASTEASSIRFDLSSSRQWATGALATQRAFVVLAPTIAFVGASTVTNAATFAISAAPIAGTNATLTNSYALWVQAGKSQFDGLLQTVASTTGTAGFRMPAGTAPTSPVDGDEWSTTAGVFARVNGVTTNMTRLVFALTDGANIAVNSQVGDEFTVTLGGNRTIDAPTNPVNGRLMLFRLKQDGTGSRTATWNAVYSFTTSLPAPTLSTAANAIDYVGFVYDSTAVKWHCLSYVLGNS